MYRLLIVDDEPVIVNGLVELFEDCEHLELDVYHAYSADDALDWLARSKFDIVLTDIRMPGMSGLEMHETILAHWPDCKVVFLTGFSNFEYIQTAMRNKSVDYVLKTEDDERIIASVEKAIAAISWEKYNHHALEKAKRQLDRAIPTLQREYLLGICEGVHWTRETLSQRFADLHIPLSAEHPVLPIIGRVDQWEGELHVSDKMLLLYALHNIADEVMAACTIQPVVLDLGRFIWLVQPQAVREGGFDYKEPASSAWMKTAKYVHGLLESVQSASKQLLRLPVSLAAGTMPADWKELPKGCTDLRQVLGIGLGYSQEMLITGADALLAANRAASQAADEEEKCLLRLNTLDDAERLIEGGQQEAFMQLFDQLQQQLEATGYKASLYLEAYYALAAQIIRQFNRLGNRGKQPALDLERLSNARGYSSPAEAIEYLRQAAGQFFALQRNEQNERTNQVVTKIHQYIDNNLDGDLSLTTLSELVYLNPYYLSRLYKQITGGGLTEYIVAARMGTAKKLLTQTFMKVHEIAHAVGFDSPAYFARLFKRECGVTPQEYRDEAKK
ncbi:response regulator [Paenibacillus sp. GCM10027626]|uniref:response regulator transcription factor n=1 Tax=Paenibacillus sp. GCM10027626 TaxID=3273411 RepID=UPI003641F338